MQWFRSTRCARCHLLLSSVILNRSFGEWVRLGARGTSLLFSSGDGGAGDGDASPATHVCYTNNGTNMTRFMPAFPASCPLSAHLICLTHRFAADPLGAAHSVTAVGGTTHIPEVAAYFSGGGFSDYVRYPFPSVLVRARTRRFTQFPRPEWQNASVTKFLNSLPPGTYSGLFNPNGRVRTHRFSLG